MTPEVQTIPQEAQAPSQTAAVVSPALRLWGLSARQLHDAYWRSKGVQCVRRGHRARLQRGAELFLLLEPDQLVLFDVAKISERLTWHNAAVTRLRLTAEGEKRYSEHVVLDEDGQVERIERRYRPRVEGSSRVILVSSARLAEAWMTAKNRHEGWDRVRRAVAWSRVDHGKCVGATFVEGQAQQEGQLIDALVENWAHPDQSIAGIEQPEPGVWHVAGEGASGAAVRIGPLWLGRGGAFDEHVCLVGPGWTADGVSRDAAASSSKVRLKDIVDVELPDEREPIEPRHVGKAYAFFKRAFDIAAAAAALVCLSPVMLGVSICIMLEDGRPLFFGHRRQGRNGRPFRCWKFRTMVRNAEKMARTLDDNVCDGPQVYVKNDPRVTRIGRILRKTNLDELPQFWNVLLGQMSLVGPRPSPDDENQYCPAWRDLRLSVRPGITGLWQLERTREPGEDFQEWIKYDIQYVQRASFGLDMAILLRTARMMLQRGSDGAAE